MVGSGECGENGRCEWSEREKGGLNFRSWSESGCTVRKFFYAGWVESVNPAPVCAGLNRDIWQ